MTDYSNKLLVVIAGPTAVGKTAISIQLAKYFHSEILSADSRQFYREMSIGTAKPTIEEIDGVPHYFIDSHSIHDTYNVGKYEQEAMQTIHQLFEVHDVLFLVGGSGLYVKAICEGLDELPTADKAYRQSLDKEVEQFGLEKLLMELKEKDPTYYAQVDHHNTHRIIRALEVIHVSGKPYSSFRTAEPKQRDFSILKIGITADREVLYNRINMRMDMMLEQGLLEEAKGLYEFRHHNALQTVGYEELFAFMEQRYDWEEAVRLLKRNSRRYAKRQMTWFNKDKDFHWYRNDQFEEIRTLIQEKLLHKKRAS